MAPGLLALWAAPSFTLVSGWAQAPGASLTRAHIQSSGGTHLPSPAPPPRGARLLPWQVWVGCLALGSSLGQCSGEAAPLGGLGPHRGGRRSLGEVPAPASLAPGLAGE